MDEHHDELADKLEQEADALGHESEKLESDIDETRSEWESHKEDEAVPGAQPADDESESDESGD